MLDISIIIPIKDESENIEPLADEVDAIMQLHDWSWECIWVNDGSEDASLEVIRRVAEREHHRYISFQKNAGQSAALWAGFNAGKGRFLTTLDGDGQNDPADIPKLLEPLFADKFDMVNGYRQKRQDSLLRKLASKIANGYRNLTTGRSVRDVGCSSRAFKRQCVTALPLFKGMHRFIPTLAAMQGFRLTEIPVNHRPRHSGTTKYTINNRLWVGLYDIFGVMWLKKRGFRFEPAETHLD